MCASNAYIRATLIIGSKIRSQLEIELAQLQNPFGKTTINKKIFIKNSEANGKITEWKSNGVSYVLLSYSIVDAPSVRQPTVLSPH